MSATDELRRILDERGAEWEDGGEGLTIIPAQDGVPQAWTVNTWPSGKDMGDCLWVQNRHPLTPEQAIAATLGERYTREDVESAFVSGYSLGTLPSGSDPQWDENRQTVDEHMAELGWVRSATLGGGECEQQERGWSTEGDHARVWLTCGHDCMVPTVADLPNFCPSCGKAVRQ